MEFHNLIIITDLSNYTFYDNWNFTKIYANKDNQFYFPHTNTPIKVMQFLDSSGRRENPMEKLVRVYKFNALYIYQMSNNLKL